MLERARRSEHCCVLGAQPGPRPRRRRAAGVEHIRKAVARNIYPVGMSVGSVFGEAGHAGIVAGAYQRDAERGAGVQRTNEEHRGAFIATDDDFAEQLLLQIVADRCEYEIRATQHRRKHLRVREVVHLDHRVHRRVDPAERASTASALNWPTLRRSSA